VGLAGWLLGLTLLSVVGWDKVSIVVVPLGHLGVVGCCFGLKRAACYSLVGVLEGKATTETTGSTVVRSLVRAPALVFADPVPGTVRM